MKNWKKIGPVTLKDTARDRYFDYDDIYEFLRLEHGIIYGAEIADDTMLASIWYTDSVGKVHGRYRYLLLDESGLIIPLWRIAESFNTIKDEFDTKSFIRRWYLNRDKHCVYRRDPIPGTGTNRWTFSKYYRHPKTTAERRAAAGLHEDEDARYYDIKARPRRSIRGLPDTYDDVQRSDLRNSRNWKQNRKKRWT